MTKEEESILWKKPRQRWLLGIPIGAMLAFGLGAAALGAFNWVLQQTSTNEFCYVCHSHRAFIQPEYEASTHFANTSGVQAQCADCHIPQGWWQTLWLKTRVSLDIIPELMGKLDTAEKYESHRREMAMAVWADYLDRDSSYCVSCHSPESMVLENQERFAQRAHARATETGQSCIECHQGLVHKLPENWREAWNEVASADGVGGDGS
ncbi:MAG: NapC/NirT family cytochrome c [Gammaproteobacteria bacterium]|nr:NapC/NirT family cytochrome c [Gammaproteobacteria bacterium]